MKLKLPQLTFDQIKITEKKFDKKFLGIYTISQIFM